MQNKSSILIELLHSTGEKQIQMHRYTYRAPESEIISLKKIKHGMKPQGDGDQFYRVVWTR